MKDIYDWVPWFHELALKIADGGEADLVVRAKQVDWNVPVERASLFQYGDHNVDPFSFIYTLASKNDTKGMERVFKSVAQVFELSDPFPLDNPEANYFPTPPGIGTLFHRGGEGNPKVFWRLLKGAIQGKHGVRTEDFDSALAIKGVAQNNLTQALFLINGIEFFPYDKTMQALGIGRNVNGKTFDYASYLQIMEDIRGVFAGCEPYEINLYAYRGDYTNPKRCFVVGANVFDDGEDYWNDFCSNNWVYTGGPKSGQDWSDEPSTPKSQGYPLQQPEPGDAVLVRNGSRGYGIGIVHENDYMRSLSADSRLHVIWINKAQQDLAIGTPGGPGFMKAQGKVGDAFREAYPSTFEMLDRLWEENGPGGEEAPPERSLNTILYGPPGTGKTFASFQRAVQICDGEAPQDQDEIRNRHKALSEAGRIELVTFHQSYGYEEFVEGLRPVSTDKGLSLEVMDGVIKRVAERARDSDAPHVLVIDEINRANISKVMGELITLVEEDKRAGRSNEISATLPHSGERFSLPENLYILGTMNTADRSIALLDVALRRRFEFEEMLPDPSLLRATVERVGENLPEVLETINARLEYLIDRDHLIGHAWLMGLDSRESLDECMRRKIIPLIAEYFFEDWSKVHAVLGGGEGFLEQKQLIAPKGLSEDAADERYRWRVKDQFSDNAYKVLTGMAE